jgi:hypothetical protein
MVIYPIAYIILSLPMAAGRMAMVRGVTPSPAYFCVAAAVITSSGVVGVTIYALTRRKLIMDTEPSYGHTRDRFGISRASRCNTLLLSPQTLIPMAGV